MTKLAYIALLTFCVVVFANSIKNQEFTLMIAAVCNFCLLISGFMKGLQGNDSEVK